MAEVIGVRFKDAGKVYYFDPCGITVGQDMPVVVETARGIECGIAAQPNSEVNDDEIVKPLKKMVRLATQRDLAQLEENRRREQSAFEICQRKIAEHQMDMKLVDVEYAFDNSKILFYFTADGRVDFRDLVKDLAGIFRTRIELRQIGVRDEAKMLGGLGICGRVFCCSSFLGDFQPVSIKMAKEQGLSLNPTKISGTCGRLMCCLKYEQAAYDDLIHSTPKTGTPVSTPDGTGIVVEVALLSGMLKVRLDSGDGFKSYHKQDVRSLRDSAPKPSRDDSPAAGEGVAAAGETPPPDSPAARRSGGEIKPPRPPRADRPDGPAPSRQQPRSGEAPRKPRPPEPQSAAVEELQPGEQPESVPEGALPDGQTPRPRRRSRGRRRSPKPVDAAAADAVQPDPVLLATPSPEE